MSIKDYKNHIMIKYGIWIMEKFEKETASEILKLMEKEEYMLPVVVLGLISIIRALIDNFGNDALRDEATHFLNLNVEDLKEL